MDATLEPPVRAAENALARTAQIDWAAQPIAERLAIIRELRHLIAENAGQLASAAAAVSARPLAEKLVSEVLPLADACRWVERNADRLLKPRSCGKQGRPFWLQGSTFEVQRQAFGLVLVIGPGNYPLFLPAVHALQALVAGNAVLLKPAPETGHVARLFASLCRKAGLDAALLTILPKSVAAAENAIAQGVDKVIFTGSSENGRDVLTNLAETNTPSVMELSGQDAVIVLADADLDLVVRALHFGTQLNAGNTCIAPRRLILVQSIANDLLARISTDLPVERVADAKAALKRANAGESGLGASIFSRDIPAAKTLADGLKTGFVVINDLIAPTADPRMPFGGVKASGFGSTRGDEGLLEMTFPHVVCVRSGKMHPHFDDPTEGDAELFSSYLRLAHGRFRFSAIHEFLAALLAKSKQRKS